MCTLYTKKIKDFVTRSFILNICHSFFVGWTFHARILKNKYMSVSCWISIRVKNAILVNKSAIVWRKLNTHLIYNGHIVINSRRIQSIDSQTYLIKHTINEQQSFSLFWYTYIIELSQIAIQARTLNCISMYFVKRHYFSR